MLRLSMLVSTIRCFVLDNPGFQLERYYGLVARLPHLAAVTPLPTRPLQLLPQLHLGKADAHHYSGRACDEVYVSLG